MIFLISAVSFDTLEAAAPGARVILCVCVGGGGGGGGGGESKSYWNTKWNRLNFLKRTHCTKLTHFVHIVGYLTENNSMHR